MNPNDINNVTNETTAPEVVQETVHQEEQSGYVNMINVQAEVLGELRKDKIGKPILVLEIAILFAIVFAAPFDVLTKFLVISYAKSSSSFETFFHLYFFIVFLYELLIISIILFKFLSVSKLIYPLSTPII